MTKTDEHQTTYRSIPCDSYSRLEVAIMHRERLRLSWREHNVYFNLPVMPTDLETNAGAEFLHCRLPSGESVRIRLDLIERMEPA